MGSSDYERRILETEDSSNKLLKQPQVKIMDLCRRKYQTHTSIPTSPQTISCF